MFFRSVALEFLKFVAFYVILKVLIQFLNVEARRNDLTTVAAVTGIFA